MNIRLDVCAVPAFVLGILAGSVCLGEDIPHAARTLLNRHCSDCHTGSEPEGGFDLASLDGLAEGERFDRWVQVFDRVKAGEMPPPDIATVPPEEVAAFTGTTGQWLHAYQQRQWESKGRVRGRRLTNLQLERTLHDLLGIDIPLASLMPDEPRDSGFTTAADGQSMSHFQLERHLEVVDAALDEAFRRALASQDDREGTFDARELSRTNPRRRTREPELIDDKAVVWSSRLIFYGRLPVTTARESGWYRFRIRASALKRPKDHGVWCTVRSGKCVSSAPLLGWVGAFEAETQPQEWTFEAWLPKGHMLEVRPGDRTLKMARFAGGQVGVGEGEPQNVPGVAIHSLTMERIHHGPDQDQIRKWLFGDLKVRTGREGSWAYVASKSPEKDAERLMAAFARRAFRRPVSDEDVAPYVDFVRQALDQEQSFKDALRAGYRALLCSPRFLYFQENPGPLDDHAIAARLSYFLWNRMPDDELSRLADQGRLRDSAVIRQQVERMLADRRGDEFIQDFAAEWLDLDQIDFTEPDPKLFPSFDVIVQQSMLDETQTFLETLLRDDLSVSLLIDSDFTFLNSRLARHYGIAGVTGDEMRRIQLRPEDHRGGVLTQGAILKVTANGTTTSPVIRGVWVSERLLGITIPPPPKNVAAIEPDIRGATTIRDMLEKHRSDPSCASCHVKVDPAGFALENFDPAGRWRERYGQPGRDRKPRGAVIDASYELPDGRRFRDIDGFRKLVLTDPQSVARTTAEKLLTYGTGGPVSFADRPAIDKIVAQTADGDYGFRSLVHAVATSPVFLSK